MAKTTDKQIKKLRREYERQLEQAVEKIVAHYRPEKIILFGSLAEGRFEADSDADLLVVKETKESRKQRYFTLAGLLQNKLAMDVLVMTPREIKNNQAIGNPFVLNIISNGKVLYEAKQ